MTRAQKFKTKEGKGKKKDVERYSRMSAATGNNLLIKIANHIRNTGRRTGEKYTQ